jgi:hypothetical protein
VVGLHETHASGRALVLANQTTKQLFLLLMRLGAAWTLARRCIAFEELGGSDEGFPARNLRLLQIDNFCRADAADAIEVAAHSGGVGNHLRSQARLTRLQQLAEPSVLASEFVRLRHHQCNVRIVGVLLR